MTTQTENNRTYKTSETTRARERRKNQKTAQVRLPRDLKDRIDALRDEMQESYEAGRMTVDANVDPEHLPIWFVIEKALDELEGHRERSRKSRTNKKTAAKD